MTVSICNRFYAKRDPIVVKTLLGRVLFSRPRWRGTFSHSQGRRHVFRAKGSRWSSCRLSAATPPPSSTPKIRICADFMGRPVGG